jgi:hypothetical protein
MKLHGFAEGFQRQGWRAHPGLEQPFEGLAGAIGAGIMLPAPDTRAADDARS